MGNIAKIIYTIIAIDLINQLNNNYQQIIYLDEIYERYDYSEIPDEYYKIFDPKS